MRHTEKVPLVVGIAGIMGAGKSTVARTFEQLGARMIDADTMGKRLLKEPRLRDAVVEAFGESIRDRNGEIDTAKLAAAAFRDERCAAMLDRLTADVLTSRIEMRIKELSQSAELIVIDAALLPEWDCKGWLDLLVVVDSDEEASLRRLCGDSRFSRANIKARMKHQLSRKQKAGCADVIIPNYGSLEDLKRRANIMFWRLVSLQGKR
jgi:dephospho-CoA kinase